MIPSKFLQRIYHVGCAIRLHSITNSGLIPGGQNLTKKVYMSPRPPPKISLRLEWTKELGSNVVQQPEGETVRQPEGEVVRHTKFFQSTQLTPNPTRDRSGRPMTCKMKAKRPILR